MKFFIPFLICLSLATLSPAEDDHDHDQEHSESDDHDHAEESSDHGEDSSKVGAGKGITEKGPLGFKLAPEALRTIGFRTVAYGADRKRLDCSSVVEVKSDRFIFRSRDGWLKKEPIEVISRDGADCSVKFKNLQPGDLIVVDQLGFLRIAEVFLEEGASHSHSH